MGAENSFEVKNIEIGVPTFFKHNNSSVATMTSAMTVTESLLRALPQYPRF